MVSLLSALSSSIAVALRFPPRILELAMTKAYDELVEFLAAGSTPATLLEFQPSQETRERVVELIHKEKTAGLLPEETVELDDYLKLEHLMRMANARARRRLQGE